MIQRDTLSSSLCLSGADLWQVMVLTGRTASVEIHWAQERATHLRRSRDALNSATRSLCVILAILRARSRRRPSCTRSHFSSAAVRCLVTPARPVASAAAGDSLALESAALCDCSSASLADRSTSFWIKARSSDDFDFFFFLPERRVRRQSSTPMRRNKTYGLSPLSLSEPPGLKSYGVLIARRCCQGPRPGCDPAI